MNNIQNNIAGFITVMLGVSICAVVAMADDMSPNPDLIRANMDNFDQSYMFNRNAYIGNYVDDSNNIYAAWNMPSENRTYSCIERDNDGYCVDYDLSDDTATEVDNGKMTKLPFTSNAVESVMPESNVNEATVTTDNMDTIVNINTEENNSDDGSWCHIDMEGHQIQDGNESAWVACEFLSQ